jgi:hypothetical protein
MFGDVAVVCHFFLKILSEFYAVLVFVILVLGEHPIYQINYKMIKRSALKG